MVRLRLDKFDSARIPRGEAPIQDYVHREAGEIDVPGLNQGVQKGDGVFSRDVEDVGVQKFQHDDAHLLVGAIAEPRHQEEPTLTPELLPRDLLNDVQELLRDEALKLAERLLLEDGSDLLFFGGSALLKNQFASLAQQGQ